MAELADALVLGSSVYDVQVQVLLSALNNKNPNLFSIGEGFGFFVLGSLSERQPPAPLVE